ncbi:hypothetical protein KUCAC02_009183, partial [Chaenocephalus aceratus]
RHHTPTAAEIKRCSSPGYKTVSALALPSALNRTTRCQQDTPSYTRRNLHTHRGRCSPGGGLSACPSRGCGDSTERGPVLDLDSRRLVPWCPEEHVKRERIWIRAKGSS